MSGHLIVDLVAGDVVLDLTDTPHAPSTDGCDCAALTAAIELAVHRLRAHAEIHPWIETTRTALQVAIGDVTP